MNQIPTGYVAKGIIHISDQGHDPTFIKESLRAFANSSSRWKFEEELTRKYSDGIKDISAVLENTDEFSGVCIYMAQPTTPSKSITIRSFNILPVTGSLSAKEINHIFRLFTNDFRQYNRKHSLQLKCSLVIPKIKPMPTSLEHIIPGKRTREYFQSMFVTLYPRPHWFTHPSDIERFDTFVCLAHRWKAKIHHDGLKQWLICEQHWPLKDAEYLIERLDVGLQILKAMLAI